MEWYFSVPVGLCGFAAVVLGLAVFVGALTDLMPSRCDCYPCCTGWKFDPVMGVGTTACLMLAAVGVMVSGLTALYLAIR